MILCLRYSRLLFFFKQKTAYEMRISDWSSDVCSSDLSVRAVIARGEVARRHVAVDPHLVPTRHVAAAAQFDALMVGPEERHVGERARGAQHVRGRRLALPLRVHPMLHAHPFHVMQVDRKSTRLNSSHSCAARMPSSACNKTPTDQRLH